MLLKMHLKGRKYIRTHLILLFAFMSITNNGYAQEEDFEWIKYNPKSKFGLRLGLGVNSLRGGNFQNPTPAVSYTGGFYHHGRVYNRNYFYYELSGSFRGSKFRTNPDSNTYSQISIFYTELPLAYMYRLGKDEEKPFFLMAGGGGGLHIRSSMLLGPNPIPKHFDLPFKRGNLFLMTGFHKYFGSVGLQLAAKWGMTNINRDAWQGFEDVKPSPDQGRQVSTWGIDFSLIF